MSEWDDFFTLPPPPKRDKFEGYGRTHGSVKEAKEWDEFFTVPEDLDLTAPQESTDFLGDFGVGVKEQAKKLGRSTMNALAIGPQMVASGLNQGPSGILDPFGQYVSSGGQSIAGEGQDSLGTMIEHGLTDTSNLNPRAVRDRELGMDPLGEFSPGAAKAVGIAGEVLADPILGPLSGTLTGASIRALERGVATAAEKAAAVKAANEVLEAAAKQGPGYALAHGKEIEQAQKILSYATDPSVNRVGKAQMRSVEPGLQLDEVDELMDIRARSKAGQADVWAGEGRVRDDITLQGAKRRAVDAEMAREAAEELPNIQGRAAAARESVDLGSDLMYQAEAKGPRLTRENAEAEALMARERRPVVEGVDEQPMGTPPARQTALEEPQWGRRGADPTAQPPAPQGTFQEAVGTPPARGMDLGEFDPPARTQADLTEEMARTGGEDLTRPPGAANQPPVIPPARAAEEAMAETVARQPDPVHLPTDSPAPAPSGVVDDLFDPTPAPKGEPQQFDLGDFDPTPKPTPEPQVAPSSLDYVPTAAHDINLVVRGDPANFRNENPLKHLKESLWKAQERGQIPREGHYRAGKVTKELGNKGTVTEWTSIKTGLPVGYTRVARKGEALEATFYPHAEGMGRGEAALPKTIDPSGRALGERRYFRTAGQTTPTPATGKPGKPPTMGREAAMREAGQKVGVFQREPHAGELPYNVMGEFKKDSEVIVNRWLGDPETGAHEMGHAFDKMFMSPGAAKLGTGPDLAKQGKFLDALGAGKGGDPRAEGWAEAVRLYVNDPEALAQMPGGTAFRDWLSSTLRAKNPKMAKVVETLRDRVQAIKGATPKQRIGLAVKEANAQNIRTPEEFSALNPVDRVNMNVLDYTAPAQQMSRELAAQGAGKIKLASGGEMLDPALDPGLFAREMRNQGATFHSYVNDGPEGVPGLRYIIEAGGDDLEKYAIAKATQGKPALKNIDPDAADFRKTVTEIEQNPDSAHVVKAWKDLGRWNEAIHRRQLEAGMIDAAEFRRLSAEARAGAPLLLKNAKGDVHTLAMQAKAAMEMLKDADLNEVAQALTDISKKFQGTGKWLEIVPKGAKPTGGRVVVEMKRGGKVDSVLHVDKDLWRSFVGLDPSQRNWAIRLAENTSGMFSKAITGHALFGAPAFLKAMQNSILSSRAQTNPLQAISNAIFGAKNVAKNSDIAKQAMKDKAFLTGWASLGAQDTEKAIANLNKRGWGRQVLDRISKAVGPQASMNLEKMNRLGEYQAVLNKMLSEKVSEKAARRIAADAARNLDVDMLTRGANDGQRMLAALSPFMNPSWQGWSNDIRNLWRLRKNPAQLALRLGAYATVPVMAYYLSREDPRMRNLSADQHARFEYFSLGKDWPLIAIPRANGVAGIWTGTIRLFLDYLDRKQPGTLKDLLEPLAQGAPSIPLWNNPLFRSMFEVASKTKSDPSRLGQPVVPRGRQDEPEMQGRLNPIQVKRIGGFFGGTYAGDAVGAAMDFMGIGDTKQAPEKGPLERVPGLTYGDTDYPRPVAHFYDAMRPLKQIEEQERALKKRPDKSEWRAFYAEHKDDFRRLKRMEAYEKKLKTLRERRDSVTDRKQRNTLNQQMSDLAEQANSETR